MAVRFRPLGLNFIRRIFMAGYVTVSAEVDGDDVLIVLENDEIIKYLSNTMTIKDVYDTWPGEDEKEDLRQDIFEETEVNPVESLEKEFSVIQDRFNSLGADVDDLFEFAAKIHEQLPELAGLVDILKENIDE